MKRLFTHHDAGIGLRKLIAAYPELSFWDRLHMTVRWRLCPFTAIAEHVPKTGDIVDLGCGHGLFAQMLAMEYPERTVTGIDLDARKIRVAQRISLPNLHFMVGDVTDYEIQSAQAVTIVDTFYLLPYAAQQQILECCADKLAPGGVVVLKDMAETPRWKFRVNWLQETLAVKVFRITEGDGFFFRSVSEWQALLKALGFSLESTMVDRGYYHPHVVHVARKGTA